VRHLSRSAIRAIVVVIAMALTFTIGATPSQARTPRIVGGSPIDITAAPWQALLRINNSTQCGGAIIADSWILSAAHCLNGMGASQVEAFVGVTDQNRMTRDNQVQVSQVIVNPDWNPADYSSDLALIGLAAPVTRSASVQPVTMPLVQDANTWPAAGEQATISGWGTTSLSGTSTALLRAATVQILTSPTDAKCGEYGSSFQPGNHVCAGLPQGGVDACQGDSGGPLTVAYNGTAVLAGIVSSGSGCADPKYPGLYTRVMSFLPWLRQYVPLPQSPPGSPTGVQVQALQGGRAFVSWTPPVNDGGAEISYVATASADDRACASDETSCVITGLTIGAGYTFSVTAQNSIGLSVPSAPTAAITAVSGTARAGSTVRKATVLRWAGKKSGTVMVITRAQCTVTARGVRLTREGLCSVKVTGSRKKVVILAVA
jgi:secreted trypsin-like serine protease